MPDRDLPFPKASVAGMTEPSPEVPHGEAADLGHVDDYRLIRRIASGGTADVFEAEQLVPVRRRVALKRIKIGMDTREVVGRFESERQALALLTHPYIARVYDAGSTKDGRPYFVLEHVPGLPIREYCDRHRLPLEARLRLFQEVCEGVQHAHHKGIIHRDLKSTNILISLQDGAPHPKIIDFGIAKALHHHLAEDSVVTELGRVLGTPEYMSPEQAGFGSDIDTRSDVYSLGILLYELLAGTRPFERESADETAVWKVIERIRDEEVPRPSDRLRTLPAREEVAGSRRTDSTSLEGVLRADLDWIVLKALEKDRSRRYSAASELSADVDRFLAGEPVLA
ncbi:MAG TPA: serine/threonine-protein kinase, partial [Candidatus Eisenbacteria bacterium]|nr:serine/threonine-protein kinase [Candidatus Eisenbacteria bacterium]